MQWINVIYGLIILIISRIVFEYVQELNYRRKSRNHGCESPPILWSIPLGIPRFLKSLKQFKNNTSLEKSTVEFFKGSPTIRLHQLTNTTVFTKEPEVIKSVLATHFKEFDLGRRYQFLAPFLGDGVFTLSGSGWYHSRQLLRPQFASDIVSRVQDLEKATQVLIGILNRESNNGYIDAQDLFFRLTLDTATEFLFGESTNSLTGEEGIKQNRKVSAAEFANAFNQGQELAIKRVIAQRLYSLATPKEFWDCTRVCHEFVDYYVSEVLKEKRENPEKIENGRYYFLRELVKQTEDPVLMRSQALNILLAGRDTTASLLSLTFSLLARHKHEYYKLRQAILEEFGDTTEKITFSSLKRCEQLRNVINEVLRLHPIVPTNARTATKDTVLNKGGGKDGQSPLFVSKGTVVAYSTYAMQRDPEIWGVDADEFKPDRWYTFRPPSWTYIPFNGGPRICLGQQFALGEASYVLCRLIQSFSDIEMEPVELSKPIVQTRKLTLSVGNGVHMRFIK